MKRLEGRAVRFSLAGVALALVGMGLAAMGFMVDRGSGEQVDGALAYARRCAFCHDIEGAIGAGITAATLASHGDEEALYRYLRLAMPYEAPGTMSDAEYRAIARHLVETRGIAGESGGSDLSGNTDTEGDMR